MEKSSISNRSSKLFTLSAIKNASKVLLGKGSKGAKTTKEEKKLAIEYWNTVAANMSEWQLALQKKVATSELRNDCIHAHGVFLQAMGQIGYDLLTEGDWKEKLKKLSDIDWSRSSDEWQGRAMVQGRISKACLLYTSPSPRDQRGSRMPSSA